MNSAMIPTIRQSQPLPSYTSLQKRESSFPTNEVLSAINVSPPETIPLSTLQKMAKINPELDNFFKKHNLPSQVRVHHIYYAQDGDKANLGIIDLIEVGSGNSKKFIEVSKVGAIYKTLDDFFHNNNIGPGHYMYFDESKKIPSAYHRKATAWEQVRPITDIGIGVLTLGAAGAVIFMSSGTAAPVILPIANGILTTSGIYFGATSAIDVAGDLKHDRMTLRTIGNVGMVVASALPFAGAGIRGLKAFGQAAEVIKTGTNTEKAFNAMIGFSHIAGIGGNVTAITSFTAEQIQTLYEIGTMSISANKGEEKSEREKMLLVAAAQMLGNVGLIVITHKAGNKILKQGDKLPAELLPRPENKALVRDIIKWSEIKAKFGETPAAIKKFYEAAKVSGKTTAKEAVNYLSHIYSTGSQAIKNSIIIFAYENNLAIIPEVRVSLLAAANGRTIKGPSEIGFRKPYEREADNANIFFAKQKGSIGGNSASAKANKSSTSPQADAHPAPVIPLPLKARDIFSPLKFAADTPNRADIKATFGDDTSWQQFFEKDGYFKLKKGVTQEMIDQAYADPRIITGKDIKYFLRPDYKSLPLVKPDPSITLTVKRNVIDALLPKGLQTAIKDEYLNHVFTQKGNDLIFRPDSELLIDQIKDNSIRVPLLKFLYETKCDRFVFIKDAEIRARNLPENRRHPYLDLLKRTERKLDPAREDKAKLLSKWLKGSITQKASIRGQAAKFWEGIVPDQPYEFSIEGGRELGIRFDGRLLNTLIELSDDVSAQFIRSVISTVSSQRLGRPFGDNKIKELIGSGNGPKEYEIKINGDPRIYGTEESPDTIYFKRFEQKGHK